MKVTDPKVKRLLARANSEALWSHIDAYPDDEIEGLTEMGVFIDELEYLIWLYEEDGNVFYDDLQLSETILKETHNGTTMPVILPEFKFKYSKQEVEDAKETVNEYRRLKRILKECLA